MVCERHTVDGPNQRQYIAPRLRSSPQNSGCSGLKSRVLSQLCAHETIEKRLCLRQPVYVAQIALHRLPNILYFLPTQTKTQTPNGSKFSETTREHLVPLSHPIAHNSCSNLALDGPILGNRDLDDLLGSLDRVRLVVDPFELLQGAALRFHAEKRSKMSPI
jgi:hypothetical protein